MDFTDSVVLAIYRASLRETYVGVRALGISMV